MNGKWRLPNRRFAQIASGTIVGLGSGSTAAFAVSAIGRRVREGLRIVGIPTFRAYCRAGTRVGNSARHLVR